MPSSTPSSAAPKSNSIDLGEATGDLDTILLTSTSAKLNALADASIQGVEIISASGVTGAVEINLSAQTEAFTIAGSDNNDTLTGGDGDDTIRGEEGADNIHGGKGSDTINLRGGELGSGETIDGGDGSDKIMLMSASNEIDLTGTSVSNVETLQGNVENDYVTMSLAQFAGFTTINLSDGTEDALSVKASGTVDISGDIAPSLENVETCNLTGSTGADTVTVSALQLASFTTIDLSIGTDVLNVKASGDISGLSVPGSIGGIETVNLTGTTGNDWLKLTGAQLDTILSDAWGNSIDLGEATGDNDTLYLTSNSEGLKNLSDTSMQGVETISFAGATADLVINLSGQAEGLKITGGAGDDTITGGTGVSGQQALWRNGRRQDHRREWRRQDQRRGGRRHDCRREWRRQDRWRCGRRRHHQRRRGRRYCQRRSGRRHAERRRRQRRLCRR